MAQVQLAGFFWIRQHDYQRFLEFCEDRAKLHETYEKWLYAANKGLDHLKRQGINVVKVDVDLDQFIAWCRSKNLDIDAKARTRYANEIAFAQFRAKDQNKH